MRAIGIQGHEIQEQPGRLLLMGEDSRGRSRAEGRKNQNEPSFSRPPPHVATYPLADIWYI